MKEEILIIKYFKNKLEYAAEKDKLYVKEQFFKDIKQFNPEDIINLKEFLEESTHEKKDKFMNYLLDYLNLEKLSKDKIKDILKINLHINNFQLNVEEFYKVQPFFYDKAKIFWFWNEIEFKYEIVDETDLMRILDRDLGFCGQTVTTTFKSNYIEAFKRVGRNYHPKEAPIKWIQFKNKAFSLTSKKTHDVTHDYFFTNPIPWDIGKSEDTPVMDELFKSWVGEEYVITLYQIIAYCCYRNYPIQLLFSLCGSGRNGKSQFLKIVDKFIGKDNVTSTELDQLLGNRFESFKLYKKLVCNIGETNFGVLDQSSILKKLTGGDKIGFEKKNKDPFDDYNYAKPIIASNSLPSSSDTSDGFYRRWAIIDFPNEFEERGRDIVETIPEIEYNNLAKKICRILPELLKKGKFTNQGTIAERRNKYIEMSNPLEKFINEHCETDESYYESSSKLYTKYMQFLKKNKKRIVKRTEFNKVLDEEGFYQERNSKKVNEEWISGRWINGLRLCDVCDVRDALLTRIPMRINQSVSTDINDTNDTNNIKSEYIYDTIYLKCIFCQNENSDIWLNEKPVCKKCHKKIIN